MPTKQREPSEGGIKVEPTYELSPEELVHLTNELISKTMDIPGDHKRVTVEVGSDEAASNVARHIEQHLDFFKEDNLAEGFKPYEQTSRFFISLDRQEGVATGTIRVIENSPAGFETINELSKPPFDVTEGKWVEDHGVADLDKVWDIASLAVIPEYRHGSTSLQLYRAMYKSAVEIHGIEHIIALLDEEALDKLQRFLGVAFQPLAGSSPVPYHHSESTQPVYGYLPDLYAIARQRMEAPIGNAASRAAEVLVMGTNDESLALDTKK